MILLSQLKKIIPTNKEPDVWLLYINRLTEKYNIDTDLRLIGFLSQSVFESNEFNDLFENLNYSAKRLTQVWPRRFPSISFAQQYARNPQKLANNVYANRMGNGDEASGDGWRFRGRGIKQLTGHNNYAAFAKDIGKTIEEAVVYAGTKEGAVETACWYWNTNNLSIYADRQDIRGLTRAINGGLNGLGDREYHWNRVKEILKDKVISRGTTVDVNTTILIPIGYGDRSELVKSAQRALGILGDGIFGRGTQRSVREWQKKNKYPVSGMLTVTQLEDLLNV